MIDSLEDHAIMLKVKSGDVEKLSLLYHRYSRRLFGFFFGLTSDAATSEDLVQNVFVRMLKYRKSYSESGNFEAWAFHMARNVHKDHFRKNKRYHWQEDMADWESHLKETDNREHHMQKSDELNNLERALQALSPAKRELIELTRFQKLKYDQVAALLGISESALKVRVHRTLKELRELYSKVDGKLTDRIN
ncbi:RNA polymerase sigma factor [Marinoscillum furvescens]|uniref:RNA polymerase sigma-70 factor (ECF subfamily) n=1 Tax=Marinoscillum furvescens DSM 4134 TaxID=1122208 RepID=A0A3D9L4Q2_MARFU|nr:RNA polymerase sigma factor [Marinoscillum furvescens]REE00562.1 RNA polymerase sigma-70 factor (ECF subfamily) [Marinoscillum furvescens DSM 4134]